MMRKSLSLVLVIAMMLSMFIFVIPASAAETASTLSEELEHVEAPYFETAPTIDGIVTEAEWGTATVHVDTWEVLTKDDNDKGRTGSRFLYWRTGDLDSYEAWEYDLWLRWDTNYFYIAVKVKDPDKHSLKNGAGNTWNGDAVQTRIDWNGAKPVNPGQKPWTDGTPDFIFGYTEIAGGFSEAWENTNNRGMTAFSNNPLGVANTVVAPAGSDYSSDTLAGYTTYETAIPWSYIIASAQRDDPTKGFSTLTRTEWKGGRNPNPSGGIGKKLGMSLTVLDDGMTTTPRWDAFLAWGSGICGQHQDEGGNTATGSNEVILTDDVATNVTSQAGYPTQDPTHLKEASFSTENVDAPGTYYDFLAFDFDKETPVSYDALKVLTYDDAADRSIWGSTIYNGSIVNIGGEHGNVLDFTDPTLGQNYLSSEDGEDIYFKVHPSFTFEFDIRYFDTQVAGDGAEKYNPALYNWFGGASTVAYRCGYFFADGCFEIVDDNGADGTNPRVLARQKYDLKKENWYRWRFQFDNESCNVRFWIDDLSTEADNADNPWGTMIFNVKDRYFYYAGEDVSGPDAEGCLLIFRQMNVQTQYDNVKVYNFASNTTIAAPDENTNQGGSGTTYVPPKTEESKGEVDISTAVVKDGKLVLPITLTTENDKKLWTNVSKFTIEFTIDTTKAEFEALEGIDANDYEVVNEDGKITITFTNMEALKKLDPETVLSSIVLKLLDENATAAQCFIKAPVYTLTATIPQEGDATVFVVIAAVVAMLGCAAVVVVRKRKIEE